MNLVLLGGSFKTMPIELREKLAFDGPKLTYALNELATRYGCESAILSTCNRVEIYVARTGTEIAPDADLIANRVDGFSLRHGVQRQVVQTAVCQSIPVIYAPSRKQTKNF